MPVYNYRNVTLATLLTLLQSRLQNASYWSSVELREAINEAICLYQLVTLRWRQRFQPLTIAGQVFYDLTTLPGTLDGAGNPLILMPLRVAFNSKPLFFSSLIDMDNSGLRNWQLTTTATTGAPSSPQLWGNVGLNYLFLYPADAAGNNSLQIDAAIQAPTFPTDGTGDTQYLNLDSGEVTTLLDYAQHVSTQKRGAMRLQATTSKLKSFMKAVALSNSMFQASSIFQKSYADQNDRRTRPRTAQEQSGMPTAARFR